MSNIIKHGKLQIDLDKSYHDLACIYAKVKLEESISKNVFTGKTVSAEIEQLDYIATNYFIALNYFSNLSEQDIEMRLNL